MTVQHFRITMPLHRPRMQALCREQASAVSLPDGKRILEDISLQDKNTAGKAAGEQVFAWPAIDSGQETGRCQAAGE